MNPLITHLFVLVSLASEDTSTNSSENTNNLHACYLPIQHGPLGNGTNNASFQLDHHGNLHKTQTFNGPGMKVMVLSLQMDRVPAPTLKLQIQRVILQQLCSI